MQEQGQFEGMSLSDVDALDRPKRALALARRAPVAEALRTVARDSFGSAFKRWAMVRSNAQGKQRLSRSSGMGYAMLWRAFLDWLDKAAPDRTIETLDYPLVRAFALSRNIGKHDPVNVDPSRSRYVWRLLRLIEQVLEEHIRAHRLPRNDCVAMAVDRLGLRSLLWWLRENRDWLFTLIVLGLAAGLAVAAWRRNRGMLADHRRRRRQERRRAERALAEQAAAPVPTRSSRRSGESVRRRESAAPGDASTHHRSDGSRRRRSHRGGTALRPHRATR